MTLISNAVLRSIAAAAALALGSFGAHAGTWTFSQSFGANGTISGQFTGQDDQVTDGLISFADGEVSVLTLNYTGPEGDLSFVSTNPLFNVGAFTWSTDELGALSNPMTAFDILALPESGIGNGLSWVAGMGTGFANDGIDTAGTMVIIYPDNSTTQFASAALPQVAPVAAVPEPESYLMMALGLAGIAATQRRKKV